MKGKSVLYALAVVLLMGTMGGAALADDQGMNAYGPADSSVSAQPEQGMLQQGVEQPDAGEIREPVETGAVPDRSESSSELFKMDTGEEPTVELGGQAYRPGIDLGP
jgi:hypothetical protein